jgi:hypothetical protein
MIISTSVPIVHASRACRLVRIGRETGGAKISVLIGDNRGGEQTVFLFPGQVLSGYVRFQRGVLRASGIHFDNQTFSTGPGRARRWQKLVYRLLQEGGR